MLQQWKVKFFLFIYLFIYQSILFYFLTQTLCPEFTVINHPPHIITQSNQISPSAFIPFCDFGGNMTAMGMKIKQFDVPVCNSFQAKVLNDQLCYEVDLNRFAKKVCIEDEIKLGFNFIMDYNEDRQISMDEEVTEDSEINLARRVVESNQDHNAFIYLNTIGKWVQIKKK